MLTWVQIQELPAFKTLRGVAQLVEAITAATGNANIQLGRGDLTTERTNQYGKMLTALREKLVAIDTETPEAVALYALIDSKATLTDVRDATQAMADKYIAALDEFLTSKGLKTRILSAQEAAELQAVLAAPSG